MSERGKKIFLGICIIIPFVLYCAYYYSIMIKNAPCKFAEFESLTFKYWQGDRLINQYESKTGIYKYVNDQDSMITSKVKLNKDDLLYLHRKAAEQGFWNFPDNITGLDSSSKTSRTPHYYIEYKYQHKTKKVLFDGTYNQDQKLKDAAKQLVLEISTVINDAEDRGKK